MLKVNLDSGETLRFDLDDEEGAREWIRHAQDSKFQARITGLTLAQNGVSYSLPKPEGFDGVFLFAEAIPPEGRVKGAERIICHAGNVGIVLTAHVGQRAGRVNVIKQGKQRYNPLTG